MNTYVYWSFKYFVALLTSFFLNRGWVVISCILHYIYIYIYFFVFSLSLFDSLSFEREPSNCFVFLSSAKWNEGKWDANSKLADKSSLVSNNRWESKGKIG